jgi:hypothetical protein
MGTRRDKFRERKRSELRRDRGTEPLRSGEPRRLIVISFRELDLNQGQRLTDWEQEALLAKAIELLRGLCEFTPEEAKTNGHLTHYGPNSIPKDSTFTHPKHVRIDAQWCSFGLQGKPRVIGHLVENVLYVVFLDKEHGFWPSKLKNT